MKTVRTTTTRRPDLRSRKKEAQHFEALIEEVSAKFANVPTEGVETAIRDGLGLITNFLDMDRAAMFEVTKDRLQMLQVYARPGIAIGNSEHANRAKWFCTKLLAGEAVIMGRLPEDLPAIAEFEREYVTNIGLRAICSVPVYVSGVLFGVISTASFRYKFRWPEDVIKRIHLLGEFFANAVVRARNEERINLQIGRLENHYNFERLISDLTMQLVNLDRGNLDEQIERSMEQLLLFFQLDRMALLKVSADTQIAKVTHSANAEGITAAPVDVNYVPLFPWHTGKLLAGETVCVNIADLPAAAEVDRASAQAIGIRSNLVIPLIINDSVEYVLAANAIRAERSFELDMIPRIRLLGQTFANALTRRLILAQRRQAELEAQRHRQELAHVSRITAAGELTASIAHELNQPLTGILSNAQAALRFLSRDPVMNVDEVREILEEIVEDDKRAGDVIRKLRSLVKKSEVELAPLDINQVVIEVVGLVKSDAVIRNVIVSLDLGLALPQVRGDRIQLQQVLLNLLLNSLDAVESAKGESRKVVVRTDKTDGTSAFVAVSDFGKGIAADQLDRVFEPFFTTKREGMGMGLSIAKSIIKAHGGKIWAENNSGSGATFYFTIPASP